MRISFHAANADALASADTAGSFFLVACLADMDLAYVGSSAGTLLQR